MVQVFLTKSIAPLALLEQVLGAYYGISPLPQRENAPTGKPFFPTYPALHFNMSHSGDYVLLAIGSCPLGVDIEVHKARREKLIAYALTDEEYQYYLAQGGGWSVFYRLWTRREAWVKYTGEGLGRGLRQDVPKTGLSFWQMNGQEVSATICTPAGEAVSEHLHVLGSGFEHETFCAHLVKSDF